MSIDAVLFDLDDTLVDWSGSIRATVADVAGDDLADRLLAWAAQHVWVRRDDVVVMRNTWQLFELADDTWPRALADVDPDEWALALKRFREELWVGFFADVVPCLDVLVDRHRLGLLSNNPHIHAEVTRLRLHDWFETAVELPRDIVKPHAEAFRRGCAAVGADPFRTVYVGDSISADAEGAAAAGLISVWLDRHDDPWTPTDGVHRISSLAELPSLLARF